MSQDSEYSKGLHLAQLEFQGEVLHMPPQSWAHLAIAPLSLALALQVALCLFQPTYQGSETI